MLFTISKTGNKNLKEKNDVTLKQTSEQRTF